MRLEPCAGKLARTVLRGPGGGNTSWLPDLNHFVFFGERHLRYVIKEYMAHYHQHRFHQGIGSKLIRPVSANDNAATGAIKCRSRLGGLLNFYYRDAA